MKRFFLFLTAAFMLLTVHTAAAKETANIPSCKVTLNGQEIDSAFRKYPLLQYNDIVYFPMTYYDCRYLGLTTKWEDEKKKLTISKENITASFHEYVGTEKNKSTNEVQICEFIIEVNKKEVLNSNEQYPLLLYNNITYFPITWRFAAEEFGWEYTYDAKNGLVINSGNYQSQKLTLPKLEAPNGETDISAVMYGGYYYYTGSGDDESKFYIYRTPIDNIGKCEQLYNFPKKTINGTEWIKFYFTVENDAVYMTYRNDPTHIGSYKHYKISEDGSVSLSYDGTYEYEAASGGSGYYKKVYSANGESVSRIHRINYGERSGTAILYTKNGNETEVSLEGVMLGAASSTKASYPQISGRKIYVTGFNRNEITENALYVIDMDSGEVKPVINNIDQYYMGDNGIIFFTRGEVLYRYDGENIPIIEIDKSTGEILSLSSKDGVTVAAYKNGKYVVSSYADYGNGEKKTLFETEYTAAFSNGALFYSNPREYLSAVIDGTELVSDSDVRYAVFHNSKKPFLTADVVINPYLHGDTLIYTVGDTKNVVRVELKQ